MTVNQKALPRLNAFLCLEFNDLVAKVLNSKQRYTWSFWMHIVGFQKMNTELENFKFQLNQVKEAIKNDCENKELLKLKHDLEELISLYTSSEIVVPNKITDTRKDTTASASNSRISINNSLPTSKPIKKHEATRQNPPIEKEIVLGDIKDTKKKSRVQKKKKEIKPSKSVLEWQSFSRKHVQKPIITEVKKEKYTENVVKKRHEWK